MTRRSGRWQCCSIDGWGTGSALLLHKSSTDAGGDWLASRASYSSDTCISPPVDRTLARLAKGGPTGMPNSLLDGVLARFDQAGVNSFDRVMQDRRVGVHSATPRISLEVALDG
jgi:hypothetical protein